MAFQQIIKVPFLVLLFTSLFWLGCSNPSTTAKESTELYTALDSNWYGIIPCADCPGISYELTLHSNNQFQLSTEYLEKGDGISVAGNWMISSDSTIRLIDVDGKRIDAFLWKKDSLFYLDKDDERILGSLEKKYILLPGKRETHENAATERENSPEDGIDFIATGNEPFWNLKIVVGQRVRLEQLGFEPINTPCPNSMPLEGAAGFKYDIQTEANHLIIEARRENCEDDMSGEAFGYSIHININGKDLYGCGYHPANPALSEGTWLLKSLNGKEINPLEAGSKLELNLKTQVCQISGKDGCNSFFGTAEVQRDTLYIGRSLGNTLMACDFAPWQNIYRDALEGATLAIEHSQSKLRLYNAETELIYEK